MTDILSKTNLSKIEQRKLEVIVFLDILDYKLALEYEEDFMEVVIRVTNRQYKLRTGKNYPVEKTKSNRTNPNFFKLVRDAKINMTAVSWPYMQRISDHIKNKLREAVIEEKTKTSTFSEYCSLDEIKVLRSIGFSVVIENNSTTTISW